MSVNNIYQRTKATYLAALTSMFGYWVYIDTGSEKILGKLIAVNPDHGDAILDSADIRGRTFDKLLIRGASIKTIYVLTKATKPKKEALEKAKPLLGEDL